MLKSAAEIGWAPITATIIFFLVFVSVVYRTFREKKNNVDQWSKIPFEDVRNEKGVIS